MLKKNLEYFTQHLAGERGLAANSVAAYAGDLRDFIAALERRRIDDAEKIDRETILDYLGELQEEGRAGATLVRRMISIRLFLQFLCREKLIREDVTAVMDSPRAWKLLPDFLTPDEVDRLLEAFRRGTDEPLELRNRAMLELLYSSGLRVSELAGLKLSEIDFDDELLRVTGKGAKTRIVPVGKPALRVLKKYLSEVRPELLKNPASPWVFVSHRGAKLSRIWIWNRVKEAAVRAGITKNVHPHTLRHSFASHLLANGADLRVIQEMLGHADIATTEIYTHIDADRLHEIHHRFHPRG